MTKQTITTKKNQSVVTMFCDSVFFFAIRKSSPSSSSSESSFLCFGHKKGLEGALKLPSLKQSLHKKENSGTRFDFMKSNTEGLVVRRVNVLSSRKHNSQNRISVMEKLSMGQLQAEHTGVSPFFLSSCPFSSSSCDESSVFSFFWRDIAEWVSFRFFEVCTT